MSLSFLELKDIAERYIELINPTSPEKILEIGWLAGMTPGKTVLDFGCGYAEPLVLWAENYGISGVGIDLRPKVIERACQKVEQRGLADRLELVLGKGAEYPYLPASFDYATCIGASFVWTNVLEALRSLKQVVRPGGKIILGEPYWLKDAVPPELAQAQPEFHSELQVSGWARQVGLDFEYVLHSSLDEWDRYEASNWRGLVSWMEENPGHPDFPDVLRHLHESQEEYFRYGREYFGWGLYLLNPVNYTL
jgi:SAM-dependent methyltransferase